MNMLTVLFLVGFADATRLLSSHYATDPNRRMLQNGECKDVADWHDSEGFDCNWYSKWGSHCADYGTSFRHKGLVANEACCKCKDGRRELSLPLGFYVPSYLPTQIPSQIPTNLPSTRPSFVSSIMPTFIPTQIPSTEPTLLPTHNPSIQPTYIPSIQPTYIPTNIPSTIPTQMPSINLPSNAPSIPGAIYSYTTFEETICSMGGGDLGHNSYDNMNAEAAAEYCNARENCGGYQYAAAWRGGAKPQFFDTTGTGDNCNDNSDWTVYVKTEEKICQDVTGWYDIDGPNYSCDWYKRGRRCHVYGNSYRNFGKTAQEACCACKHRRRELSPKNEDIPPKQGFYYTGTGLTGFSRIRDELYRSRI